MRAIILRIWLRYNIRVLELSLAELEREAENIPKRRSAWLSYLAGYKCELQLLNPHRKQPKMGMVGGPIRRGPNY